ncbi:Imm52 family immunity protein [Herbaspirillum rubrisubalbicans]|uniref:Immunity protein 52 domain-containing protein n=1 Tax=Herbaspirillum rubrisubalbicans TaxID=80842 RepID=A0AAD0UB86_9BURK|nr:Imm52 family immunity protein [Herbaspirillum rubrisubalbicans]AYR24430.1 hypothetical protein RC54_11550 [Herbaspirillum rubrisubalbicans]
MQPFDIQILFPAPPVAKDLAQRLETLYEIFLKLGEQDRTLRPQNWLLATGDIDGSFRYPVFDEKKVSDALIAYFRERYRGEPASSCRHVTLWNGVMEEGEGASIAYQFNHEDGAPEILSLSVPDMSAWNAAGVVQIIEVAVRLYAPRVLFVQPATYQSVFRDKPSVAWMLYLPLQLSSMQVPEAARLEPVHDANGRLIGTIIISVADAIFDIDNPDHVRIAHDIEVRLTDQNLLPRYPDLLFSPS